MLALAIDTSTRAGVTVIQQWDTESECPGETLAELLLNIETVHGRRVLPAIDALLNLCELTFEELDILSLVRGPGSFTGLRVGLATIQGLAVPTQLPVVPLSLLEVLAFQSVSLGGGNVSSIVRPVVHARKNYVYTASFQAAQPRPLRLEPDREIHVDQLVNAIQTPTLLVGNAVARHGDLWIQAAGSNLTLADEGCHHTIGRYLGRLTALAYRAGEAMSPSECHVDYLGPSQAEINFEINSSGRTNRSA